MICSVTGRTKFHLFLRVSALLSAVPSTQKKNLRPHLHRHIIVQSMFAYTVETDREDDGRWIAEVPELPGVLAYGDTREQAIAHAEALALRVLADEIEQSGSAEAAMSVSFAEAHA